MRNFFASLLGFTKTPEPIHYNLHQNLPPFTAAQDRLYPAFRGSDRAFGRAGYKVQLDAVVRDLLIGGDDRFRHLNLLDREGREKICSDIFRNKKIAPEARVQVLRFLNNKDLKPADLAAICMELDPIARMKVCFENPGLIERRLGSPRDPSPTTTSAASGTDSSTPTPSLIPPSPSASFTAWLAASGTASIALTASSSGTAITSFSMSPSATQMPSQSPSSTGSATPSALSTFTNSQSRSSTRSSLPTNSPSSTESPSGSRSPSGSESPSGSAAGTPEATVSSYSGTGSDSPSSSTSRSPSPSAIPMYCHAHCANGTTIISRGLMMIDGSFSNDGSEPLCVANGTQVTIDPTNHRVLEDGAIGGFKVTAGAQPCLLPGSGTGGIPISNAPAVGGERPEVIGGAVGGAFGGAAFIAVIAALVFIFRKKNDRDVLAPAARNAREMDRAPEATLGHAALDLDRDPSVVNHQAAAAGRAPGAAPAARVGVALQRGRAGAVRGGRGGGRAAVARNPTDVDGEVV